MKYLMVIFILLSVCSKLNCQIANIGSMTGSDCTLIIELSDKLFQDGLYDECIKNLEGVMNSCVLSKTEKIHTLELLAKAYVETYDIENAEATVNLLLHINPHYDLIEADNSEMYNRIVRKFKVRPQFSIGIRNTANWISFKQTEVYSVLDGLDYSAPYNTVSFGLLQEFYYYGWAEFEFDKDISLNADLTFVLAKYDRNLIEPPGFDLKFRETCNFVEIPIYLKKYFHIGKNVFPYVTAGVGWLYLMSAHADAEISYTVDDIITGKNENNYLKDNNINVLEMRNRSTFEWIAGVGVGYKIKNLRLFVDARYYRGLKSITNASKRFSNSMLIDDYFYIDNSVKLNQFELGASISYTLKNSVKRIRY